MRRTVPQEGPGDFAAAFVRCASDLSAAYAEEPGALRMELHIRTPADWMLWRVDAEGRSKLLGRRERNASCTDAEARLFATARAMIGSIVGRLSLHERCWLLNRLSAEEDASGITLPYLRVMLDMERGAFGLRPEAV